MANSSLSHPTVKFICSYGGKILPRYTDGKLRYSGGDTRVIAVNRSISFSELIEKLGEVCGAPVALRCQLPTEDLDALISIKCDEDLVNLIEEYDRTPGVQSSSNLKIKAFLTKKSSPNSSICYSSSTSSDLEIPSPESPPPYAAASHFVQQSSKPSRKPPFRYNNSAGNLLRFACENSSQNYLVHSGNHWE